MLNKIPLFLIANILLTQPSSAGLSSSTPLKEEQRDRRQITRKPVPVQKPVSTHTHKHTYGDEAIIAGMGRLTVQDAATNSATRTASISAPQESQNRGNTDNFSYLSENFSQEAWMRENGLSNSFLSPQSERRYERQVYPAKNKDKGDKGLGHVSQSVSKHPQKDKPVPSEMTPQAYNYCPVIDLGNHGKITSEETFQQDFHPEYIGNLKRHLKDEIFRLQLAYQRSETKENKIYIITKRNAESSDSNLGLQNAVSDLLQEDYFSRRIAEYQLEKEGLFTVILRKNCKKAAIEKREIKK